MSTPPKRAPPLKGVPPERACIVCGNWTHKAGPEPDGAQRCHGHSERPDLKAKQTLSGAKGRKAKQPKAAAAKSREGRKEKKLGELAKQVRAADIGTPAGRLTVRRLTLEALFAGMAPTAAGTVERILSGQANEAPSGEEVEGNTEISIEFGLAPEDEPEEPPAEEAPTIQ